MSRFIRLQEQRQMREEAVDWLYCTIGAGVIVGLMLATPWLRAIASVNW